MPNNQSAADRLSALIEGVRQEAYEQGFRDATKLMRDMVGTIKPPVAAEMLQTVQAELPERKPVGHNREVALKVLSRYGRKGATQAAIIREARVHFGETLAQSSTRHALNQLRKEGKVRLSGKHWRRVEQKEKTAGTAHEADPAGLSHSSQGGQHATTLA